ncbi:MAG TPA: hypothetical protein VIE63_05710 [Ramlibacter sp.]|jgi:hypothetical protein
MDTHTALTPARLRGAAAAFVAIGLLLYVLLLGAAERVMMQHGESNPLFKVASVPSVRHDWVVLGSSHAMPLGFGGFNEQMERETGLAIVNLAATGAGPLYNRFVLEQYLRGHRAANVLYVVDAFAFYSNEWNEERFADAKLLARTPWEFGTLESLAGYVATEGVSWRAGLDYATGFSKINNRDRFKPDRWEGAAQFDKPWRPSTSAVKKRIDYLYPDGTKHEQLAHHLAQLDALAADAARAGARVTFVRLPLPAAFKAQQPDEKEFDDAISALAAQRGAALLDLRATTQDAALFFDSDHLNRRGVELVFEQQLKGVLTRPLASPP